MSENKISVVQLPIIQSHLLELKEELQAAVDEAMALVCTDENLQSVKNARSKLNARLKEFEEQRISVKNQIMEPYLAFEKIYNECIRDILSEADKNLGGKVKDFEGALKKTREDALKEYFQELVESEHLEWLPYSAANLNVTLSASMKSLRKAVSEFVSRIAGDITVIESLDFSEEITVEYKKCLNLATASTIVKERNKALEKEKNERAAKADVVEAEAVAEAKVEAFAPARKATTYTHPPEDACLSLTFTVRGTREKLKKLKTYLEENGYDFK